METVLLVLAIGFICIFSFITGVKVGQKVLRGETVETPNLNPIKAVKEAKAEHKAQKEREAEDEFYATLMHNIDAYDGTNTGQKRIPIRK